MIAITFRSISCRTLFPDGKASVAEPALPPVPPASLRMEGQGLHPYCHSAISAWSMFPWGPLATELWRGALRDSSWSLLLHLEEGAASNHFWPPFLSYTLRGQLQQNTWLIHWSNRSTMDHLQWLIHFWECKFLNISNTWSFFFSSSICSFQGEICGYWH